MWAALKRWVGSGKTAGDRSANKAARSVLGAAHWRNGILRLLVWPWDGMLRWTSAC
jgi:hypothetical protein